jgi:ubiquinone/menaquinone biosynthesis C-methylase UbiE
MAGLAALAAQAGYDPYAIDTAIQVAPQGVRAASASIEALPFSPGSISVVAMCASLHYARNVGDAISSAAAATKEGGVLIVALSPMHRDAASASWAERGVRRQIGKAAGDGPLARGYRHLVAADVVRMMEGSGFRVELKRPNFSAAFRAGRIARAVIHRFRTASFPTLVATRGRTEVAQ